MKKGFTLIETLVVMGIIGLLAAAAVLGFSRQQAKSRDTRRQADLNTINTAINSYKAEFTEIPTTYSSSLNKQLGYSSGTYTVSDHGGWDYSSEYNKEFVGGGDNTFMKFLVDSGYLDEVPKDPVNNGTGDVLFEDFGGEGFAYAYFYYEGSNWKEQDRNGFKTYQLNAKYELSPFTNDQRDHDTHNVTPR